VLILKGYWWETSPASDLKIMKTSSDNEEKPHSKQRFVKNCCLEKDKTLELLTKKQKNNNFKPRCH
jgi:hypothetical protein